MPWLFFRSQLNKFAMKIMKVLLFCHVLLGSILLGYGAEVKWSTVNWTTGRSFEGFKDPDGNKFTSSMNYAVSVFFYADAEGKNALTTSPSTSSTPDAAGSYSVTTSDTFYKFISGQSYYVKAQIENDKVIRSTDILKFDVDSAGSPTLNFQTGIGFADYSGGSAWGDWTEKGGDVPEPTTCSLLLVGLAGMGLKRLRKRRRQQA